MRRLYGRLGTRKKRERCHTPRNTHTYCPKVTNPRRHAHTHATTGLRIPTWNGGRPGRLGSYVELCLFIKSRPGGTAGAGEHVILIHINTGLTQNSGLICSVAVGGGLAARRGRAGQPILFKRNVADGRVVRRDLFWWTPLPFTGCSQGVDHSKLRAIRAIHVEIYLHLVLAIHVETVTL